MWFLSLKLFFRTIGAAGLRKLNTVEEKKTQQEGQTQTSDQNTSLKEEIDKLNNEIAQLTEKNNDLLVSHLFLVSYCVAFVSRKTKEPFFAG